MKIIILGAGQVGTSLAENLAHEKNDITLIDTDAPRLKELQNRLDIQTVLGPGSRPDVLRQAGAADADMLIAVTNNDETNMLACQVASTLFQVTSKLARVRASQYLTEENLFSDNAIPVDYCFSPELLVTQYVKDLIEYPSALQVINFAEGKVQLVAIKPGFGGLMVGRTIAEFYAALADLEMRIVAIYRGERSIAIHENTTIEIGDEVFFIAASNNVRKIMGAFRKLDNYYKRIMIAGGGNIGFRLAQALEDQYQVKIIEGNIQRSEYLASELENVTVLQGDASDKDLLVSENIEYTDVFCAVTNDDKANIMSALLAKRLGARTVMALVTRTAYIELIEGSPIDIAISPQQITIGSILTLLRKGDVIKVHSLRRGAAEVIEIVAHGDEKTSKVVGREVRRLHLPHDARIGALIRGDQVIIACRDMVIEQGDHVIILVMNKRHIRDIEKLFQVSVSYFR